MKKTIITLVVFGFVSLGLGIALAQKDQENMEKNIKVTMKETTGVVSALSGSFIAVETGADPQSGAATESAFNLDKNVRIEHKNSLKEIKIGDTVAVGYAETIETKDDGSQSRKTSVKTITFLRPAPQEMTSQEAPTSPAGGGPEDTPLSLKGLKER